MHLVDLFERASDIVYHYTNVNAAAKILETQAFDLTASIGSIESEYAPAGYPYFLSTTRTLLGGYHRTVGSQAVMFNLDGRWLNSRYKAGPVDYWGNRNELVSLRPSEAEDRIYSKSPRMPIDGITAIHVYVRPLNEKEKQWATSAPAAARKVLLLAKKLGIPAYYYEDEVAWRKQNIKQSIPITRNLSSLKGQEVSGRGYTRTTSWMEPWIELIFKNKTADLSPKAKNYIYDLEYSYDTQSMIRSLANDFANARKPGVGPDRPAAVKIISWMTKNNINDLSELVNTLKTKWAAIKERENTKPVNESYKYFGIMEEGDLLWSSQLTESRINENSSPEEIWNGLSTSGLPMKIVLETLERYVLKKTPILESIDQSIIDTLNSLQTSTSLKPGKKYIGAMLAVSGNNTIMPFNKGEILTFRNVDSDGNFIVLQSSNNNISTWPPRHLTDAVFFKSLFFDSVDNYNRARSFLALTYNIKLNDIDQDEFITETLKKVKGKWALVSRKDPSKVLQYYHGSDHPSKEWVNKVERRVHSFSKDSNINEIGYADTLGELSIPTEAVIKHSKSIGVIDGKHVFAYKQASTMLYFFKSNDDVFDALVLLDGNHIRTVKNYSKQPGAITALIGFIVHRLNTPLEIVSTEQLTSDGFRWLKMLLQRNGKGFTIVDNHGQFPNVEKLEQEWITSRKSDQPGTTSIRISENATTKKLLEEKSKLIITTTVWLGNPNLL